MGKVQALRSPESPRRSPERERLAAAIERHKAAQQQMMTVQAAKERAFERFLELNRAAESAAAALEEAKANESRRLVADLMGEPDPGLLSLKEAAAAVEAAETALADIRRARETLDQREREVEKDIEWAQLALSSRIQDVVRSDPAIRKLAAECIAARDHYRDLLRVADWLGSTLPEDLRSCRNVDAPAKLPTLPAWQAAVKALETDPDVALPS